MQFQFLIIVLNLFILGLLIVIGIKLRSLLWSFKSDLQAINKQARSQIERFSDITLEIQNAIAISHLGFKFPVFLGGPSIDSFHARQLIQELVARRPHTILELGSGSSTVVIAIALQLIGIDNVYHVSVDHDVFFLNLSKKYAELNGVAERIKFAHCPLTMIENIGTTWYSNVAQTLERRKIELLIIDGPPAYKAEHSRARFPALPLLYPHLAEKCAIFLDDANRPGEKEIIKEWLQAYPEFRLNYIQQGKGLAILYR